MLRQRKGGASSGAPTIIDARHGRRPQSWRSTACLPQLNSWLEPRVRGPFGDRTICTVMNDLRVCARVARPQTGRTIAVTSGNVLPLLPGGQVVAGSNPVSPTQVRGSFQSLGVMPPGGVCANNCANQVVGEGFLSTSPATRCLMRSRGSTRKPRTAKSLRPARGMRRRPTPRRALRRSRRTRRAPRWRTTPASTCQRSVSRAGKVGMAPSSD